MVSVQHFAMPPPASAPESRSVHPSWDAARNCGGPPSVAASGIQPEGCSVTGVDVVLVAYRSDDVIEAAVDRVSLDFHDLSKRAKDIGSAAVMLALLLCAGIWCSALWQRFVH